MPSKTEAIAIAEDVAVDELAGGVAAGADDVAVGEDAELVEDHPADPALVRRLAEHFQRAAGLGADHAAAGRLRQRRWSQTHCSGWLRTWASIVAVMSAVAAAESVGSASSGWIAARWLPSGRRSMKVGSTAASKRSASSAAPTGVQAGFAEEVDEDPLHLGVLVDQHAERAGAAQRSEERPRRAGRPAHDGAGAEAGAQVEQHRLQPRLVDLARHDQHPQAARVQDGGEELPVAAVPGHDDDRAALAPGRFDMLPAGELDMAGKLRRRAVAQVEALAEHRAQMREAALGQGGALADRELRKGEGEVVESAPAVAAREPPGEAAERPAETLRPLPAQAGEEEIEQSAEPGEQARPQRLGGGRRGRSGMVGLRPVGVRRGEAVDDRLPDPPRLQQPLGELAHGTAPAARGGDVVHSAADVGNGIRRRRGQAAGTEHREIEEVVGEVGDLAGVELVTREEVAEGVELVLATLQHLVEAEIAAALLDDRARAGGEDADFDSRSGQQLDAETVAHVEDLDDFAFGVEPEPAVGEHAVDVEEEPLDLRGRAR